MFARKRIQLLVGSTFPKGKRKTGIQPVFLFGGTDGHLNRALAIENQVGASAKAFPRGKGDHVSGG